MRRPAMNILLLVIYCLWCHLQPTAGRHTKEKKVEENELEKKEKKEPVKVICTGTWKHLCATTGRKRTDIGDLAKVTDLGAEGGRPDRQEARGGERRGEGGRESDEYRDSREGDDLRSEFSDLRQLSEERQLSDIGNHQHTSRTAPLDPALGRLRSLLRTLDLDDREEEKKEKKQEEENDEEKQEQEEEPPGRSSTDTNRRYIMKDNLTMLRRILDDIERRLDSQPASDSVSKKQAYADDAENK